MLNIEVSVFQHIKEFFRLQLPQYEVLEVRRKSVYPEDSYLFMVSAAKEDDTYAVWTPWNESTQCLNHGHYDLQSYEDCEKVFAKFFKYGKWKLLEKGTLA